MIKNIFIDLPDENHIIVFGELLKKKGIQYDIRLHAPGGSGCGVIIKELKDQTQIFDLGREYQTILIAGKVLDQVDQFRQKYPNING